MIDHLWSGTRAMRASGYLVKFDQESDEAFKLRQKNATFLPFFRQSVKQMTGRVFAEPIKLRDDVPPAVAELMQDVDGQGNNLQVFARRWFMMLLRYGVAHVIVDHPPRPDGVRNTQADYRAARLRPYARIVAPTSVPGWRAIEIGGLPILDQFRIVESVFEPEGEFGVRVVEQIRVIDRNGWKVYRNTDGKWTEVGSGLSEANSRPLSRVPVVTLTADPEDPMTSQPPLIDVAYLNVKHFNGRSDQDGAVRFARIRLGAIIGGETDKEITLAANSLLQLPDGGNIIIAQGSAESVTVGAEDLDSILQEARQAGAALLRKDIAATRTATQAKEEAAQEISPLEAMALGLQDGIDQMMQLFADWLGEKEGGHCEVRGNFDEEVPADVALPNLIQLMNGGVLSKETTFHEVQRRGVVADEITWEDERGRIEADGPALATLNDDDA